MWRTSARREDCWRPQITFGGGSVTTRGGRWGTIWDENVVREVHFTFTKHYKAKVEFLLVTLQTVGKQ